MIDARLERRVRVAKCEKKNFFTKHGGTEAQKTVVVALGGSAAALAGEWAAGTFGYEERTQLVVVDDEQRSSAIFGKLSSHPAS
jgi:hypothetical protein